MCRHSARIALTLDIFHPQDNIAAGVHCQVHSAALLFPVPLVLIEGHPKHLNSTTLVPNGVIRRALATHPAEKTLAPRAWKSQNDFHFRTATTTAANLRLHVKRLDDYLTVTFLDGLTGGTL